VHLCSKGDVNDRVIFLPVPVVVKIKPFEKLLFPEKGLPESVKK